MISTCHLLRLRRLLVKVRLVMRSLICSCTDEFVARIWLRRWKAKCLVEVQVVDNGDRWLYASLFGSTVAHFSVCFV
jgi:hypothetical protein